MKLKSINLSHKKGTEDMKTVDIPLPQQVTILLSQHMGAPCNSLVNVGDHVLVGQKIADTDAFMSAPIHSSVSGNVTAIKDYLLPNSNVCKAVVIDTDGEQTVIDGLSKNLENINVNDKKSLVNAVRESGCCGLGGAGFPTHIKLNYDENKTKIDYLVINGAECEPYITSDYREFIENTTDVLDGIKILLSALNIPKAVICIEDNKPRAIKEMSKLCESFDNIEVKTLKSSYPQGAEKVIAFAATGRIIKEGELPSNQGIIVMNVSTVGFIARYLRTGMPLVKRRITIDGDVVENPCNVWAPVGTPVINLLNYAGADVEKIDKLLAGGPMMGMGLIDVNQPVTKTSNAVLAFKRSNVIKTQTACIHCGRCVRACPMNLSPAGLEKAYDTKNVEALKELKVTLCMNCGCCSYVCPAKRNLAEKNQLAKALIPRK